MKTLRIEHNQSSYPLFLGDNTLNKLPDLLSLYRFPERGFILTQGKLSESGLGKDLNFGAVVLPPATKMREFSAVSALLKVFPWSEEDTGATLVALGSKDLANLALFTKQLIAQPITLVLVPHSAWCMLECGVGARTSLAWQKKADALVGSAYPDLVILDCNRLNQRDADELFLMRTAMTRILLLADRPGFASFTESWPDMTFSETGLIYDALEAACQARMAVWGKGDSGKFLIHDFGKRASNRRSFGTPFTRRELALSVHVEMGWRLGLSRRFEIIEPDRLDPILALLKEIRNVHEVTAREWGKAKQQFEGEMAAMLHNLHVPEDIGRLQKINAVEENAAMQSLKSCHL